MGFFDDRYTENQKKYIRFSYEMAISIMLVIALEYAHIAYEEGSADCRIAWEKRDIFYSFDEMNFTDVYIPNTTLDLNMTPINIGS